MINRKVRVLEIQSRICIGGPAIHTEIVSRHLPKDRYRVTLVGGAVDPDEKSKYDDLIKTGINIKIIPEMRRSLNPWQDLLAVLKVYRLIRKEKPDIVTTHTAKAGTIGRIAARFARVPVIFHMFHGHTFEGYFPQTMVRIFKAIEKTLAHGSSKIFAISPLQQYDLGYKHRIAPPAKIELIRLGLELDRFLVFKNRNELKIKLGLATDEFVVGILGRMAPIKNLAMAMRVLDLLHKKSFRCQFVFAGDGEERAKIEKMCNDLGVRKHVHFLGWINDVESFLSGIDALLLTSLNEGTPISIIEAMASGVPVVATNVGGVPDLIKNGETGFTCRPNDDQAMSSILQNIMRKSCDLEQIKSNARNYVFLQHHYQRLVEQIDNLYWLQATKFYGRNL